MPVVSGKQMFGMGALTQTLSPQCLETSSRESGGAVQSEVVNQNENRDLANTNTNTALTNATTLERFIKKNQDFPSQVLRTQRSAAWWLSIT